MSSGVEDHKSCKRCGSDVRRRAGDSEKQWAGRKFCSASCRNKSANSTPAAVRFWRHVNKGSPYECWVWTGSNDGKGYGQISAGAGRSPIKAHRLSWEIHNGQIPAGMVICHRCDNPKCVNPSHLFVGTQKDNMVDCATKNRLSVRSRDNLRPGCRGFHGAGPRSNKELRECAE